MFNPNMQDGKPRFKVYSSNASQWAGVVLLGLAEKGYPEGSYEVENIDLLSAGNFHPDYVKINRNGTIPSLTSPSLPERLIESADILVYLNDSRPSGLDLSPKNDATSHTMNKLIELVHSPEISTNIILLDARDSEEMKTKQNSPFNDFLSTRQNVLESHSKQFPDSDFYKSRREMNGAILKHYISSDNHQQFFKSSHDDYRGFAAGINRLESLLVLPYAAGSEVTLADLHIVPWLAHAMWGAGTQNIDDLDTLETLIQKTVSDFKIGPKTKQWWDRIIRRESVKKVYPHPH